MRRLGVLLLVIAMAGIGVLAVPASAAGGPLAKVTVTGAEGEAPKVHFAKGLSVKKSTSLELTAGTGEKLTKGTRIIFDYVAVDGRNRKVLDSSYGKKSVTLTLDPKQALPPLVNGLLGTSVGSRVLVAIAPKEGLARQLKSAGAKKTDTVLFAIDVRSTYTPLTRAEGEAVAPVAGLPTVALAADGTPTVTIPGTPPSATLVAQPLIKGAGAVVTAGQTITVHYRGIVYGTGATFDSSWKRGSPSDFPIGAGQVVAGWDEGLVGQTVGSQVLLVIPPDKGYGANGNAGAKITGTDTLVFVVDILGAI